LEWLTILAIILGPILSVQAAEWLDDFKEKKKRRLLLFETLMKTRATRLSQAHVEALNLIDVVFYGKKAVVDAWKVYHDHFGGDSEHSAWGLRADELFKNMMMCMAKAVGFDIDELTISKGGYLPKGFGWIEDDQEAIRKGFVSLLKGEKSLPVINVAPPETLKDIEEIRKGLAKLLKSERITILPETPVAIGPEKPAKVLPPGGE